LGAASVLAAQSKDLDSVAITMLAFGFGAAAPLLALGLLSSEALARWRGRLISAAQGGKYALGVLLLAFGILIVSGLDKKLETVLVNTSPAWLSALTTRF
jgi:cytochrome c-type biogenesis protein